MEIMKLNMISKLAEESNQEARRLEDHRKDELKLQREREKEDKKEERLMIAEQNRHEQIVMQGQQFQMMMMMQGKSLMPNNNSLSLVTESPRSILKDPDVILHLDNNLK